MKKVIMLTALFSLMAVGFLMAGDNWSTPSSRNSNALISADYGGFYYSAVNFSSAATFISSGEVVIAGVIVSSGAPNDYVVVYDTYGVTQKNGDDNTAFKSNEVFRVYTGTSGTNVSSNFVLAGGPQSGTIIKFPPIRTKYGLGWRISSVLYNVATLLYYVPGGKQ